jgi:hypothetical protein
VPVVDGNRFAYLPGEKQAAVLQVRSRYEGLIRSAEAGLDGLEAADGQALAEFLRAQQEKRLAELLTPGEKFEYDLRESECAQRTRDLSMTLSEGEFRSVVWIQRWYEEQWNAHASEADFDDRGLAEARAQALREALADRYPEYEQVSDPYWEAYVEFVEARGMDRPWADWLRQCRNQYAEASSAIANDPGLNPEVRDQQLAGLRAEFAAGLQRSLGANYPAALDSVLFWVHPE